ncbi:MAG: YgjV family protein [Flavobacteriales bacterium]|nr:YgjV family protein [Flavobacteriales bacterium]MCB9448459.1 YgjV family protein [Flavobacteriales bacterium]
MAGWMADTVGFVALILNLYSMASRGEYRLRLVSAIANAIYVVYGVLISAAPVIIGCSIAVGLHVFRMYRMKTDNNA